MRTMRSPEWVAYAPPKTAGILSNQVSYSRLIQDDSEIHTFDYSQSFLYNRTTIHKEVMAVMRKKYHVALTGEERRLLLEALIFKKNKLLSEGRYTDAIDEIILNVMKAKIKKYKVKEL